MLDEAPRDRRDDGEQGCEVAGGAVGWSHAVAARGLEERGRRPTAVVASQPAPERLEN